MYAVYTKDIQSNPKRANQILYPSCSLLKIMVSEGMWKEAIKELWLVP